MRGHIKELISLVTLYKLQELLDSRIVEIIWHKSHHPGQKCNA